MPPIPCPDPVRAAAFGAAADVRDHFASGRRQDHADREAAAVRRRDPDGGAGEGARQCAAHALRLARDRAGARHLGHLVGDDVRAQRRGVQSARYAGPCGLFRGYLPHAERGRRRGDGDRCRERHREPDAQAVRGVPAARHPDHHLHQQDRPRRARPARAARRDFLRARARSHAADVAGRDGRRLPRLARYRECAAADAEGSEDGFVRSHRATGKHPGARNVFGHRGAHHAAGAGKPRTVHERPAAVRRQGVPRRASLAGDLRQRAEGFRRDRAARLPDALRAGRAAAQDDDAHRRAAGKCGQRLRVQGAGQHGPEPSRPHRVRAAVFGQVQARHAAVQCAREESR